MKRKRVHNFHLNPINYSNCSSLYKYTQFTKVETAVCNVYMIYMIYVTLHISTNKWYKHTERLTQTHAYTDSHTNTDIEACFYTEWENACRVRARIYSSHTTATIAGNNCDVSPSRRPSSIVQTYFSLVLCLFVCMYYVRKLLHIYPLANNGTFLCASHRTT